MVLHDVAHRARLLVEPAAALDADRLGHGDLHVVDEVAVPDGLEDAVGEAQDEDVLDGLLAEVMVDPEDLALAERRGHGGVERLGRGGVAPERLLDHERSRRRAAARQAGLAEHRRDEREDRRRRGQIEDGIALASSLAVGLRQPALQFRVRLGIVERAPDVGEPVRERVPDGLVDRLRARMLLERFAHLLAVSLVAAVVRARNADQREGGREHVAQRQVVERRQQLAVRQVARGAEDDERPRAGNARHAHAVAQRIRAHAPFTA